MEGCCYLHDKGVLQSLLSMLTNEDSDTTSRRSAIISLGHIGSTPYGFKAIHDISESFMTNLIQISTSCSNFSLRGAAFFALGLIGKSSFGAKSLIKHGWEMSPSKGVAVAIPSDPAILFKYDRDADDPINPRSRTEDIGLFRALYPFIVPGKVSVEVEIMSNISKVTLMKLHYHRRVIVDLVAWASFEQRKPCKFAAFKKPKSSYFRRQKSVHRGS